MTELTLVELAEKLKREDEVSLLEMLSLTSEDIIDRFMDVIEERFDILINQIDD